MVKNIVFDFGGVIVHLQPDEAIDAKCASLEDIEKMIADGDFVYAVGKRFEKKAQIAGGIILIFLGVKILLEHLGVI